MENLDTLQRKNNMKIRGLKETMEGKNLVRYLVDLFTEWIGSDRGNTVKLLTACRIGAFVLKMCNDIHEA